MLTWSHIMHTAWAGGVDYDLIENMIAENNRAVISNANYRCFPI